MQEVSTAAQLETLTQHLKQRRWPEPTKFRSPPWLAAFADCTAESLRQRCSKRPIACRVTRRSIVRPSLHEHGPD